MNRFKETILAKIESLREKNKVSADKEYAQYELDVKCGYGMALDDILPIVNSLPEEPASEELPNIRHRDTLDEFAYQCAYDLSNDWAKETPKWNDVKTACKLGAQWQKEQMMSKAVDGLVICDKELTRGYKDIVFSIPKDLEVDDKVKMIIIKDK